MRKFSGWSLLLGGLSGQRGWRPQWRAAQPKTGYDAIIVGGGGHGLGAAYYLAKELNYNVMYSPRGVLMLAHSVHDEQVAKRHIHANYANGVDNEWLTPAEA